MKTKLTILIFLIIAIPGTAYAEPSINIRATKMFLRDAEWQSGVGVRVEGWWRLDGLDIGAWVSRDPALYAGQWGAIVGVGPGVRYHFNKNISAYLLAGKYKFDFDESGFEPEALYYAQVRYWCPWLSNQGMHYRYGCTIKSNYGVTLGLDFTKKLTSWLHVGLGVAYRKLNSEVFIRSYNSDGSDKWYLQQSTDFGGFEGSAVFRICF